MEIGDRRPPSGLQEVQISTTADGRSEAQNRSNLRLATALGIALVMALTGCGETTHVQGVYSVSAMMESYPDGTARACRTVYDSLPADCASTLSISELGNARLPFLQVAATRGAYLTPTMKLTGTWTGSSLALTAAPSPAAAPSRPLRVWSANRPPSEAQIAAGQTTAAGLRDQQVLMADLVDLQRRGILVMENGFDQAGLYILVAAPDPASVDLLRSRYKVQEIDAWLHPNP